jgi:hypothetical protein
MNYCGPRGIELDAFLRWSQRSQDAALEWAAYEGRRCQGCGTHPDEWAEDRYAYHAHLSSQCLGCLAAHRLNERFKDGLEPGVTVVLPQTSARDCTRCTPTH